MNKSKTHRVNKKPKVFSFFENEIFSSKVILVKPVFLVAFLLGLLVLFYFSILNPDIIFSVITGIVLFTAGFMVSNVLYLNASGKMEDNYNRLIVHESSDLFLIYKISEGRFKFVSNGLSELLGYDISSVANKYDLSFVHPADRLEFYNLIDKDFLRFNRNFVAVIRMVKRDGNICWIKMKGDVLVDAANNLKTLILNLRDVSLEKRQQIADQQYQKSLEQTIDNLVKQKEQTPTKKLKVGGIHLKQKSPKEEQSFEKKFQPALTFRKLKLNV